MIKSKTKKPLNLSVYFAFSSSNFSPKVLVATSDESLRPDRLFVSFGRLLADLGGWEDLCDCGGLLFACDDELKRCLLSRFLSLLRFFFSINSPSFESTASACCLASSTTTTSTGSKIIDLNKKFSSTYFLIKINNNLVLVARQQQQH